jgi:glycerol-3-phosphate acyltransferase PlsY
LSNFARESSRRVSSALFDVLSAIVSGIFGYVLGSIPTAFLLVQWKSHLDIRSHGSGNVGTLNSYQVSGSKGIAAAVLFIDFLKGWGAVGLAGIFWPNSFANVACAGVGAVAGHNFPVWLKFKGGRGLATGTGALVAFGWPVLIGWGFAWVVGFGIMRKVNPANAAASTCLLLAVILLPTNSLESILSTGVPCDPYRVYCAGILATVLVKHVHPLRQFLKEKRKGKLPRI